MGCRHSSVDPFASTICCPRFESQAHHLSIIILNQICAILSCEKNENKQKEARLAHLKKDYHWLFEYICTLGHSPVRTFLLLILELRYFGFITNCSTETVTTMYLHIPFVNSGNTMNKGFQRTDDVFWIDQDNIVTKNIHKSDIEHR